MSSRYVPGDAAVLIGDRGVVATGRDRAAGLLPLVGSDPVVLAVIDSLSGGVLANLPDFACAVIDGDDLRIVLRGGFTATAGGETWSGEGAATWREYAVPGGTASPIVIGTPGAGSTPEFPISGGVVLASRVTWLAAGTAPATSPSTASTASTTSTPSAQPTQEPEPTPEPTLEAEPIPEPEPTPAPEPAVFPPPASSPPPSATIDPERDPERTLIGSEIELQGVPPGDHDGRTITAAQLQALKAAAADTPPRPRAAVVLPDGVRHPIAPRLVIGRRPQARQVATAQVPALVTVEDPYVSSTHLELALVDDQVVVTDLSTNGTLLARPGQIPAPLEKNAPTTIPDGSRLSLSDDLVVTIELRRGA
ncbi:MAG: FHA domain-containing protein [Nocardioides sp.]|uniref:FHA domain-containing protein n=1 Tax=Nocardioides sp. TaxID=35761 RepID=UPI0039E34555